MTMYKFSELVKGKMKVHDKNLLDISDVNMDEAICEAQAMGLTGLSFAIHAVDFHLGEKAAENMIEMFEKNIKYSKDALTHARGTRK